MLRAEPVLEKEWARILPGVDRLWSITKGSPNVCVAVIDGPVDSDAVRMGGLVPASAVQHGTHVASIIAGSRDGLVCGLAPGCSTKSIEIFTDSPDCIKPCTQEELAKAIDRAVALGAHILNISSAQILDASGISLRLSKSIENAIDADMLLVAAAGNQGCACDVIPAAVPGVLAVGAHDENRRPLPLSNWGIIQRTQGVLAPGSNIPGACIGGGVCRGTGTSFSCALVTAVAALVMSVDISRSRKPSGRRTRDLLLKSADRCQFEHEELCGKYLLGVMNVERAANDLLASTDQYLQSEAIIMIDEAMKSDKSGLAEAQFPLNNADISADSMRNHELGNRNTIGLVPMDCECSGSASKECSCNTAPIRTQLVYAIGRLNVSFTNQARRDSLWRRVNGGKLVDFKALTDESLKNLFKESPFEAQAVVWTLSRSEVPMYAITPLGAFAADTYKWLVEEWSDPDV